MIKVKLSTDLPYEPIIRQTPGSSGIWENFQFFIDQEVEDCDYWVVYNGLTQRESCYCPPQNTIFITAEPPDIKKYNPIFLRQFARILTFHRDIIHPKVAYGQPGLNWHVGRILLDVENRRSIVTKTYDDFKAMRHFEKHRLLSVVSSNKDYSAGHRKRLEMVQRLKEHFGDSIDIFGHGIRDIDDKWDAIAGYKYHVAIENNYLSHYWTEKLADTYLAGAYPIYYGCPNLKQYFSSDAYTAIDINNPEQVIKTIEQCIDSNQYERSLHAIMAARDKVLDEYNMFPMIADFINRGGRKKITIRPGAQFTSVVYRLPMPGSKRRITISP
ncbi:glycosyltransferase family 10 domain-containing protein [Syntrophomonas palmitatica]|uniref:glycosyltransferase family 10 domain-containing protein n=1 Tax=Syntrophomonas palmitatica TaxID=402877 RepID=UPI0006D1D986|nr:glycosyltransferase family 10 [Syntrophomonas palmitatica]